MTDKKSLGSPSWQPGELDTFEGAMRFIIEKSFAVRQFCRPAIVQSYDPATNRAVVKIVICDKTMQGEIIPWGNITDIPVMLPHTGGMVLSLPLQPGDTGFLIASERDISLFKQEVGDYAASSSYGVNTGRKNDFLDGFFIPMSMKGATGAQDGQIGIQTKDGSVGIWVGAGGITIKGNINQEGGITSTADIVAGGKSLMNHDHNVPATGLVSGGPGAPVSGQAVSKPPN